MPPALSRLLSAAIFRNRKIHLALEDVDARNKDLQLISDGKAPARLATDEAALG